VTFRDAAARYRTHTASDHDLYITDLHNVRDVPRAKGRFGFDEYIQHIVEFLQAIGPGAHVVAVCQPCVAVLEPPR
jgi:poly-beta-hydroxyalkanoate depolymerase